MKRVRSLYKSKLYHARQRNSVAALVSHTSAAVRKFRTAAARLRESLLRRNLTATLSKCRGHYVYPQGERSGNQLTGSWPRAINLKIASADVIGASILLGSSMVEHSAVNRRVPGSSPGRGAKPFKDLASKAETPKVPSRTT